MNQKSFGSDSNLSRGLRLDNSQIKKTKICNFYDDIGGRDRHRLAVNRKFFPDVTSLKSELTRRLPLLPSGVRRIFTPRLRTEIKSLENLRNEGHYVCTSLRRPRGEKSRPSPLKGGTFPRPNDDAAAAADGDDDDDDVEEVLLARELKVIRGDGNSRYAGREVSFVVEGQPERKVSLVVDPRWTLQIVLRQASRKFQIPVRRITTSDGKEIQSLSQLLRWPQPFVACTKNSDSKDSQKNKILPRNAGSETGSKLSLRENVKNALSTYHVIVKTGTLPSAGTSGDVRLTICGESGSSGGHLLANNDPDAFQCGKISQFIIRCRDIGKPFKVRIELETDDQDQAWFCDEVKVIDDIEPEVIMTFPCGRWLSLHDDNWQLFKELPLVVNGRPAFPVVNYEIFVKTGNVWRGGTSGKVFVTIRGGRGDSGRRDMRVPIGKDLFSMDQLDSFSLELVWLGDVESVVVSHEGERWFLEWIRLKCRFPSTTEWIFPCHRWLSEKEDDGLTERELKRQSEHFDNPSLLEMFGVQAWKFELGRTIELFNSVLQETASTLVVQSKNGRFRSFQKSGSNKLLCIRERTLTYEDSYDGACDLLVVPQVDHSMAFKSRADFSFLAVRKFQTLSASRRLNKTSKFHVYCKGTFRNGNTLAFDTSAVQSVAIDRSMKVIGLSSSDDLSSHWVVRKISRRIFAFESFVHRNHFLSLGPSLDCHCSKSKDDSQFRFRIRKSKQRGYVRLESALRPGIYVGITAGGIMAGMEDQNSRRVVLYPRVVKFNEMKSKANSMVSASSLGNERKILSPSLLNPPSTASRLVDLKNSPNLQSVDSPLRRYRSTLFGGQGDVWTLSEEEEEEEEEEVEDEDEMETDGGQEVEELPSMSSRSHSPKYSETEWKVTVTTVESLEGADVCVHVFGSDGACGPVVLGGSASRQLFRAGNVDDFKVDIPSRVGNISKLRLELLSRVSVMNGSWKVASVKLCHVASGMTLKFKFHRWLSRSRDDGDVVRELPVMVPHRRFHPVIIYSIRVSTGDVDGAETEGNVFVNLFGEFGNSGDRLLHMSRNELMFRRGQEDVFSFEAVFLGRLKYVVLSRDDHPTNGRRGGWFCSKIVVSYSNPNDNYTENVVFPCLE